MTYSQRGQQTLRIIRSVMDLVNLRRWHEWVGWLLKLSSSIALEMLWLQQQEAILHWFHYSKGPIWVYSAEVLKVSGNRLSDSGWAWFVWSTCKESQGFIAVSQRSNDCVQPTIHNEYLRGREGRTWIPLKDGWKQDLLWSSHIKGKVLDQNTVCKLSRSHIWVLICILISMFANAYAQLTCN